jgi:L-threonylcarbamoyladenylate synthase
MTQVDLKTLIAGAASGEYLVSFPTDTVPALAVRPDRAELIFAAKQRRLDKPLILMGASSTDLWPFVMGSPDELDIWQQVAKQYWPGALTLVLPASDRVPTPMNPLDPTTLGIRVPKRAIAWAILAQTGPLATTSANYSRLPPLLKMAEIEQHFPDVLTVFPDNVIQIEPNYLELEATTSQCPDLEALGTPSTVAKWNGQTWDILRQGIIKLKP